MTSSSADRLAPPSPWSARETEFLTATLELLRLNGYERLTVDAVAAAAKTSKATVYRRWSSKADLVLAAFIEGVRQYDVEPDTGTLRGDLLALGTGVHQHAARHAGTICAVVDEMARNPALSNAMQVEFLDQRKAIIDRMLRRAVDRGEIDAAAICDELWDLLPGYLIVRNLIPGRAPTDAVVTQFVDQVLLPSLTRTSSSSPTTRE